MVSMFAYGFLPELSHVMTYTSFSCVLFYPLSLLLKTKKLPATDKLFTPLVPTLTLKSYRKDLFASHITYNLQNGAIYRTEENSSDLPRETLMMNQIILASFIK